KAQRRRRHQPNFCGCIRPTWDLHSGDEGHNIGAITKRKRADIGEAHDADTLGAWWIDGHAIPLNKICDRLTGLENVRASARALVSSNSISRADDGTIQ